MKHKNTLQSGSVRYLVFRDAGVWYAVGLELNIVESGSTPEEAFLLLAEAVQGYVESARKIKARPHILNQRSDPEYETKWRLAGESKLPKREMQSFFAVGRLNISRQKKRSFVPA